MAKYKKIRIYSKRKPFRPSTGFRIFMKKISRFSVIFLCFGVFFFQVGLAPVASAITISREEEMAKEFLKTVFEKVKLVEDPMVLDYVNHVGDRIVSSLSSQVFSYHFYVIQEDVYNAFASPAGHIFVNSGLLAAMEDEEELAGILAHEIAHVLCRHISQRIERSKKIGYATLAGLIASVLVGAGGSSSAGSALGVGSMAAGQSLALAFSREDEIQADQLGMECLRKAGYTGAGLLSVLGKIRSKQWFGTQQIPTYLMTHPAVEDRMAYVGAWLDRNPLSMTPAEPYVFDRVRARVLGRYTDEATALKWFENELQDHPDHPALWYGYGLALARAGERPRAIDALKRGLERKAFDPYLLQGLGELYFLNGRYADALSLLEGAAGIGSQDPDTMFYLGRTFLELGKIDQAAEAFETLVQTYPRYDRAFYFLGESYGRKGDMPLAHYFLGQHYHQQKSFQTALFHLKKAAESLQDPEKKAEAGKLIREIEKLKRSSERDSDGPVIRRPPLAEEFIFDQSGRTAW